MGWMLARTERAKLAEALLADSGRLPGATDRPCRPGHLHGLHAGRLLAGRPGCHQDPQPPALLQRQPVFRGPFPHSQVPAQFSQPVSARSRKPTFFADVSSLGTTRTTATSGTAFHTPADVHYGRAELLQPQRAVVLQAAYAAHPERLCANRPLRPPCPRGVDQPAGPTPG